jgi:two-component system, response regulator YesN
MNDDWEVAMAYKVFFVEDEIVTREGIRDKVDWRGHGFEFCGEAPDGEIALPLLQTVQPDVLITDIKMPFMDGLELSRIVHERMPATKIVILSGHDEFEYAQKAIKLGVTEYLLKPVTVQDLHRDAATGGVELDHERQAQEDLERLRSQVEETRASLRQRLLLDLVVGAMSSAQAIEQAEELGLDLVAPAYLVVVIKIEPNDPAAQFDYQRYARTCNALSHLFEHDPAVFLVKKDLEEIVLVVKGESSEALVEKHVWLRGQIEQQASRTECQLVMGSGTPKRRITDICASFVEALASLQSATITSQRQRCRQGRAAQDQQVGGRKLFEVRRQGRPGRVLRHLHLAAGRDDPGVGHRPALHIDGRGPDHG